MFLSIETVSIYRNKYKEIFHLCQDIFLKFLLADTCLIKAALVQMLLELFFVMKVL